MSQLKFAFRSSAAIVISFALLGSAAIAQNVQLPGAQTQGFSTGMGAGAAAGAGLGAITTGGVPSIRSVDPLAVGVNPTSAGAQMGQPSVGNNGPQSFEPFKLNDFQKYVLETTGFKLPLYGQSFFENSHNNPRGANNAFAPVDNAPVTSDYPLGPGDQLVIRGWGSLDIDVRATIDRNGMVTLPCWRCALGRR